MADTIEKIAENIEMASQVILQPLATFETLVRTDVDVAKAIADLEWYTDMTRIRICARPENTDNTSAAIKTIWKNETLEERRLLKIAGSFQKTLKQLLYRASK